MIQLVISDLGQLLLKRYQGMSLTTFGHDKYIFIKEALSIIWKEAANELKNTSTLMEESSALSILK
jgi:hypothetical protein